MVSWVKIELIDDAVDPAVDESPGPEDFAPVDAILLDRQPE